MFVWLYLFCAWLPAEIPKASQLIEQMNRSITNIKNVQYDFTMDERWFNKTVHSESHIRVRLNPTAVYLKFIKSNSPAKEVLYNPELYGSKAQISIGKYIPTIGLNVSNVKMRNEQHHTIIDAGFGKLNKILYRAYKDDVANFDRISTVEDNVEFGGRKCWRVVMFSNQFTYVHYIVQKGETLARIANSKGVSEYLILEKNEMKDYTNFKEGQDILIPNAYSKRFVCLIDKENYLPIYQEVYDDKGIFEKYSYSKVKVKHPITEIEFSKKNKEYCL
ncbi:MAG: DUF1571 domain-containing protein [Bacteroidetes bacterium]|nr:DUF1571 domain-containing protein [Bacteroidota bacterium]